MIYNLFFLITVGTLLVVVYWAIRAEIADEARWAAQRLREKVRARGVVQRRPGAARAGAARTRTDDPPL